MVAWLVLLIPFSVILWFVLVPLGRKFFRWLYR